MKVINNCLVFTKEDMHLPCECMAAEEHEFIKTLSAPKVLDTIKSNAEARNKALRMCQRILDIDKMLDDIRQAGAWPKASAYTPPFDHEYSSFMATQTAEQLLQLFIDNYSRFQNSTKGKQ